MLYYTHVNEDNELEKQFMDTCPFEDLVCIAGSGERVIALLAHPFLRRAAIVDRNEEALYLLELKLSALENLSVEDYLKFIGFEPSSTRRELFDEFKNRLSAPCRDYWNLHFRAIEKGVLHHGHFERFLNRVRTLLRLFLGKSFYQVLDRPFWEIDGFPHRRWKLVQKLFSVKWLFRVGGNRDIAFIAPDARQEFIPYAFQKSLEENRAAASCMFHLVFLGHLKNMDLTYLPSSLNRDHLRQAKDALRNRKINVRFYHMDVKDYLLSPDHRRTTHVFYSFSDLLSFCDFDYLKALLQNIPHHDGNRRWGVFRAFVRHRLGSGEVDLLREHLKDLADMSSAERTNMYQVFGFKK